MRLCFRLQIFRDSKLPGNQSSNPEVIRANLQTLYDVMVYDESKQPSGRVFIFISIYEHM